MIHAGDVAVSQSSAPPVVLMSYSSAHVGDIDRSRANTASVDVSKGDLDEPRG